MGLRIKEISFQNFRNYPSFHLADIGNLTIFIGPNAIGKTNAMEGIQLLTAFGSFRNPKGQELVRWGQDFARLEARIVSDTRDLTVSTTIQPGSRTHALNGKRKSVQELQGLLPSVTFSPDDLALVKGAQTGKRAALDLLGCQLSKNHRVIKADYEKIVRHKNALLRDEASAVLVDAMNDMLVPAAAQLFRYRQALVRNLVGRMARAYEEITGGAETVDASYIPSWAPDEERAYAQEAPVDFPCEKEEIPQLLERALHARRAEEMARRRSVVGPHADRLEFFVEGRNAAHFASQGQQRSLVLAWKIAEVGLVRELMGVKPVLLLDDVMSELDASRRHALVELLRQDIQTFMTTTDAAFFEPDIMERANVYDLLKWGGCE